MQQQERRIEAIVDKMVDLLLVLYLLERDSGFTTDRWTDEWKIKKGTDLIN